MDNQNHVNSLAKTMPKARKLGLALLGGVQTALLGGIVFGWASIDSTLLVASESDGGAGLSSFETTKLFGSAATAAAVGVLLLGPILDRFGPRACSVTSHVLIALGMMIFANASSYSAFLRGICLLGFGGQGIQSSVIHVANLFPQNRYLVVGMLAGSITLSFAVFAIFDWIWDSANTEETVITFRTLFGSYTVVVIGSLVASCVFWPDQPFELISECNDHLQDDIQHHVLEEARADHLHMIEQPLDSNLRQGGEMTKSMHMSKAAIKAGQQKLVSLKDQSFYQQLSSTFYIRSLLVFLVSCFLANFYVGSFSDEIQFYGTYTREEQHKLGVLLTLLMSGCGFLWSLVVGSVMDQVGLITSTVITLVLGILQLLVVAFLGESRTWLIISFVLYTIFRSFLYNSFIGSLSGRLGFKYFGLLMGIGFALSGVTQSFIARIVLVVRGTCGHDDYQEATQSVSSASDCSPGLWMQLHMVQIGVLILLLSFPVLDYCELRAQDRSVRHAAWWLASSYFGSHSGESGDLLQDENIVGEGSRLLEPQGQEKTEVKL